MLNFTAPVPQQFNSHVLVAHLLPTVATAIVAVGVIWLAVYLLTRAVQHLVGATSGGGITGDGKHTVRFTRSIRSLAEGVGLLTVILIMLRGTGLGVPSLTWPDITAWAMGRGLRIVLIFFVAFVFLRITDYLIEHFQGILEAADAKPLDLSERRKRIDTVGKLLRSVAAIVFLGAASLMALRQIDVDITPILTGAGVLGVALGFGAQTLVKDVIAGLFLILENQIRVGDVITVNGKTGQVETLRLRIMTLRGQDGSLYVFQNGAITEYTNLTKDYSYAVLDLSLPYKEDLTRVSKVLEEVGRDLQSDSQWSKAILSPLEVLGVDSLAGSAVVMKVRVKTLPMQQWAVDRELRRRIKTRFDAEGITLN